jgi:hypothetical protein
MEEYKTSPLTQDIKVGYYYLENYRISEAKRKFMRMRRSAHKVASENSGSAADQWKGIFELLDNIVEDINNLERKGKSTKEIAKEIKSRYANGVSADEISEMGQKSDFGWEATAERLGQEKDRLEEELRQSEEEFMGIYREHEDE